MTEMQRTERYTPGRSTAATAMMAERRAETHGQFFLPHLMPGQSLLDIGCDPGTTTVDLARAVAPAGVLGIDAAADQIEEGRRLAVQAGASNVTFEAASCYEVPAPKDSVDRVFSPALLEHLTDPVAAASLTERQVRG